MRQRAETLQLFHLESHGECVQVCRECMFMMFGYLLVSENVHRSYPSFHEGCPDWTTGMDSVLEWTTGLTFLCPLTRFVCPYNVELHSTLYKLSNMTAC